jgi:hypothetical protein
VLNWNGIPGFAPLDLGWIESGHNV